ncbi:PREDICTED: uncharacterized protein LOC108977666, partial [Bactrocera latifrons]|uniref:uncharacterized protein LOC108977666 n=1 Tax=Bactrocera latifrons TaxID=174628 RepID=UPI0008DE28B3
KMYPKRLLVKIEFQLHAVTCPGVWLCTHGYLEVTIKTLGYYLRTGAMEPRFPLLCHDKFTMDGYFKSVDSPSDLESVLAAEQMEITLWQNGRRMAFFIGKLADVMKSDIPKLSCEHNINVQLLMKATPAFPGIIAPKVELSAHIGVQDRPQRDEENEKFVQQSGTNITLNKLEFEVKRKLNRHTQQSLSSTNNCFNYLEEKRRQRPVCHLKTNCGSGFSKKSSAFSCPNAPKSYKIDAVSGQNSERRLSTGSSNFSNPSLYNLSQVTRMSSPSQQCHSICTVSSISAPDDHLRRCETCQSYRKVFCSKYFTNLHTKNY